VWTKGYDITATHNYEGVELPRLSELCLRLFSSFNVALGGDSLGKYNHKSTERCRSNLIGAMTKLYRNEIKPHPDFNSAFLYYAIVRFYKLNRQLTHKLTPMINTTFPARVPLPNRDVGIIHGDPFVEQTPVGEIRYLTTGKKPMFKQYLMSTVVSMIEKAILHCRKTGLIPSRKSLEPILWKLAEKPEVFTIWDDLDMSPTARESVKSKLRLFFIPSAIKYILDFLLQKPRMMFERGRYIMVGMKWLYGGAQRFFEMMHGGDSDYVWFEGDWSRYDLSILSVMLMLYNQSAAFYYDKAPGTNPFYYLLEYTSEQLVGKIVRFLGNEWRMIIGEMPSGDYNTSHGDSWIQAVLWHTYVISVEFSHPERKKEIQEALRLYKLWIAVFGDDYLMCVPRALSGIISGIGYGEFLKKNFYMEQKASTVKRHDTFLSQIDSKTGEMTFCGPKFLKRYFIKMEINGVVQVVAYRPTRPYYVRSVHCVNPGTDIQMMIRLVGMAWDTMGTNIVAYYFIRFLFRQYERYLAKQGYTPDNIGYQMHQVFHEDPDQYNKYFKKVGFEGQYITFPTLEELHAANELIPEEHFPMPFLPVNMHLND
jgi:hypothetical protein